MMEQTGESKACNVVIIHYESKFFISEVQEVLIFCAINKTTACLLKATLNNISASCPPPTYNYCWL